MTTGHEPESDGRGLLGRSPLQALRRHWLLVAVTTVVATAVAGFIALNREPTYHASIQMVFSPPGPEFGVLGFTPTGGDPAREAATNVIRVGSRSVAAAAARELGDPDVEALRRRISVTANPNANVVDVTAEAATPEAAQRTAIAYADAYRRQQRTLEVGRARAARRVLDKRYDDLTRRARRTERGLRLRDQIEQLAVLEEIGTGSPRLLGRPREATRIDSRWELIVLGGLLGLVVGCGLAFVRAASDRRLRDDDELAASSPVPVLATIPRSRALRRNAAFAQLPPEAAEAFRRLYARLQFGQGAPRVVVVTSVRDGEGKTTVAMNLAAGAASSGDSVLLIEADLRQPDVATRLRVRPGAGLIQILQNGKPGFTNGHGPGVVTASGDGDGRFDVLGSGGVTDRAAALLKSPRMDELLADVRDNYDLVVVDTPPIGRVADAVPLISQADGVLLCTLIGRSDREETVRVAAELADMGATVLGVVVNGGGALGGAPYQVTPAPASPPAR
jgi:capsular exopolysaccharide synthesis family protein